MQPFNFTDTPVDKGMTGTLFDTKITDIAKKEEEWKKKGHVYVLFKKEGGKLTRWRCNLQWEQ